MNGFARGGRMSEVVRFEHAGDERRMLVGEGAGNTLTIRQDVSGPSALLAYGEEERSMRMIFSPDAVAALVVRLGTSDVLEDSLWSYFSDEGRDLTDLMDLCDASGIPYSFAALGSSGQAQFRPASALTGPTQESFSKLSLD